MKNQILVSGKGILKLIEAPLPQVKSHEVLIRTYYSVVSAGTETTIKKNTKMSNLLRVAYKKAELVKKLGIRKSLKTFSKVVEGYQTLGYSLVGKVVAVGKDVVGIEKGDNVVATGAAKAIHAKYVTVPNIYVTKVNDLKPDMAFAGVLTIGLNGFIKADVTIGDDVAIIGGGLIGELTASCFKFAGVKVDIIEINSKVTKRLKKSNFNVKKEFDKDYDAIVIATDTTKTFAYALEHLKFQGRVIITGYGNIIIDRAILEEKQLSIGCVNSYGLGANNIFYELNKGDILSEFNVNTARKNLDRAVYFLEHNTPPQYRLVSQKDYKKIGPILKSKDFATVVIKWING